MLVTVTLCGIKGATFDCLEDAIERKGYIEKERGLIREESASPARVRRLSAPDLGIDLLRTDVSLYLAFTELYAPSSGLIRLYSLAAHPLALFNRNLFFLTNFVLSVVVRVCVYARLSYSLSLANLTCLPRGLKTYANLRLVPPRFLDPLVQDPRGLA